MSDIREKLRDYAEKAEKIANDLHDIATQLDSKKQDLHSIYLTLRELGDAVDSKIKELEEKK